MECTKCNSFISASSKYCAECGIKVTDLGESTSEFREYARGITAEGKEVLKEIRDTSKKGLKSDMGKSMITWGAAGAVAGVVLPFVGPLMIGALGAGYGALRKL